MNYIQLNKYFYSCIRQFSNKKILVDKIWEKDENRINEIKHAINCKIYIVWEKNWLENKEKTIDELIT
jgi:hypothetical protein